LVGLGSDDLLDPLGDVAPSATACRRCVEAPARTGADVCLDRIARELRDRRATPFSLVSEPGV
jgi:hypothetical protein